MVVDPATMPVTIPVLLIVPVAKLPLLHVPPVVASLSDVVNPAQTCAVPVIAAGTAFTVTIDVTVQPLPSE